MGWLFSRQWETRDQLLEHLRRTERFSPRCELIKSSPRGNNHWYVAKDRETGRRWIGLDLMKGGTRTSPGWATRTSMRPAGPLRSTAP